MNVVKLRKIGGGHGFAMPEHIREHLGWDAGDTLVFDIDERGRICIEKVQTTFVPPAPTDAG